MTLPHLSDQQKRELCVRLEQFGLLCRDKHGRWWMTESGRLAGVMLYAMAMREAAEDERDETGEQVMRVLQ
jgi:hypothetical protein